MCSVRVYDSKRKSLAIYDLLLKVAIFDIELIVILGDPVAGLWASRV